MKKVLATLLAASLAFGSVALPAAESGETLFGLGFTTSAETSESGFEYKVLDDGTIEITRYTGDKKEVVIPSAIENKRVTSIGDSAFKLHDYFGTVTSNNIKSITIPNGITNIGESAFSYCDKLTTLTLPDSVTSIGKYAFENCSSLKSVNIPSNLNEIKAYTFMCCESLRSIVIPNNIKTIGKSAFAECSNLEIVNIPSSVEDIGESAFSYCTNLYEFFVDEGNKEYSAIDGVLFNKDITELLQYPIGNTRSNYIVPDGVLKIDKESFMRCKNITNLTIPQGVMSIGDDAFSDCNALTDLVLPDTIESIGAGAFMWCGSLKSIILPSKVPYIGGWTFYGCTSLENILIPNSVTSIGIWAFSGCSSLTSITIPNSVISVGYSAFCNCRNLMSISIPNTMKNIGKHAFGFSYIDEGEYYDIVDGVTLGVYTGTAGEEYVKENGIPYDLLDHTHSYTSAITKQPTCTAGGVKTFTCKCGDTYTESIPATDHKSSSWITDKPAAIGVSGSKHKSCTVCGKVLETAIIPALARISLTSAAVKLSNTVYAYDGAAKKPTVTLTLSGKTLKNGTDYTVSYVNNVKVGTATVKIVGKGNYTGTITKTFSIKNDFKKSVVSGIATKVYTGKALTQNLTVKFGTKTLKNGTDYSVTYSNNVKVGTATVKIVGKGNYTGTITKTFAIKNDFKKSVVSGIATKVYTGKALTQNLTVKFGTKTLKNGTDYSVTYSNNVKVGTATVKIIGKGSYTGTITKTFKINPAKQSISKLVAKSKGFVVNWLKKDNASGYQLQYTTDSKFKTATTVVITSKNTVSKTVAKLAAGKRYYVRIRTYTTINGVKYYGAWSAVKNVVTKK